MDIMQLGRGRGVRVEADVAELVGHGRYHGSLGQCGMAGCTHEECVEVMQKGYGRSTDRI
jgi:hypothetical protein